MRIEVVYAPAAGRVEQVFVELPEGACLRDAVQASGLIERHGLAPDQMCVGVWGRVQPPQTVLRADDRVEIYRPLQADPKQARRQRQAASGSRWR